MSLYLLAFNMKRVTAILGVGRPAIATILEPGCLQSRFGRSWPNPEWGLGMARKAGATSGGRSTPKV